MHSGGSALDGILPHVERKIDGHVRGAFDLAQTGIAPYPLGAIRVAAGAHEIAVAFTNDAYQPPQDRTLRVEKVVLQIAP